MFHEMQTGTPISPELFEDAVERLSRGANLEGQIAFIAARDLTLHPDVLGQKPRIHRSILLNRSFQNLASLFAGVAHELDGHFLRSIAECFLKAFQSRYFATNLVRHLDSVVQLCAVEPQLNFSLIWVDYVLHSQLSPVKNDDHVGE